MASMLSVNKRSVPLTNLTKLLWPEEGYTKQDLIKYYIEVSPFILPHLKRRPLVVQRFPEGIEGEAFYQKNFSEGFPDWIETCPVLHGGDKITNYILADNVETLVWLGNQACLELHPWLSSIETLEQPDYAVFDLDPMEASSFGEVCRIALMIRDLLSGINLTCYPKTSGATGMQLYLPLEPVHSHEEVRRFVGSICHRVNELSPNTTTMERAIKKRGGKIYLDYLQNVRGKTIAAPYSLRPLHGAPVSMPLFWHEVNDEGINPQQFTIQTALRRLNNLGDIFGDVNTNKQRLPSVPVGP